MSLIPKQITKGAETAYTIIFILAIFAFVYMIYKIVSALKFGNASGNLNAYSVANQQGQGQYYNNTDLESMAAVIYDSLEHGGLIGNWTTDDNEDAVKFTLLECQTTGDVRKIEYYLTKNYNANLKAMVRGELEPADIAEINQTWKEKDIRVTL